MGCQLPDEQEKPVIPQESMVVGQPVPPLAPVQIGLNTLEKFIKNKCYAFQGHQCNIPCSVHP